MKNIYMAGQKHKGKLLIRLQPFYTTNVISL